MDTGSLLLNLRNILSCTMYENMSFRIKWTGLLSLWLFAIHPNSFVLPISSMFWVIYKSFVRFYHMSVGVDEVLVTIIIKIPTHLPTYPNIYPHTSHTLTPSPSSLFSVQIRTYIYIYIRPTLIHILKNLLKLRRKFCDIEQYVPYQMFGND